MTTRLRPQRLPTRCFFADRYRNTRRRTCRAGLPCLADGAGPSGTGKSPAGRGDPGAGLPNRWYETRTERKSTRCGRNWKIISKLLLPKDRNNEKSVILEVRGGAGGEEAALFLPAACAYVHHVCAGSRLADGNLDLSETELGGVREAILEVNGRGVYHRLKFESRVPACAGDRDPGPRPYTATVAVMPQAEDVEIEIPAQGPAHRHLPVFRRRRSAAVMTSSAIRITTTAWSWSARMSAVSSKIKIKPWRSCAAVLLAQNSVSSSRS